MIQLPSADEERRRLAMIESLGLSSSRDQSLQSLAALAADVAEARIGLVSLIESDRIVVAGAEGFAGDIIDRWDSFCGHALFQPSRVLWIEDARLDHRFRTSRYVVKDPHIRFYAGVPLRVNGCMVGTLCVLDPTPRAFDVKLAARLTKVGEACAAELAERHRTNAMRTALAASADALVDCDADGVVCCWSDGAEHLFGFSRDEAVGSEITLIIPPEHREGHREGMRRWRASGAARLGRRLELPARRKDGSPLDIELWMSVSHDNGQARIHANIRDISERRAQSRALSLAMRTAEEASRAKTVFLANMSHELRTPLNGVTACAGLLAGSNLAADQKRLVEIIEGAADHLSRLIGDLLDVSRIEAGQLKLDVVPVDLGELVDGLADLCRLKADEKGVDLRVSLAADARMPVLADAARLKQVLSNLVSNAIKFTDEGEVALTVTRTGRTFRFEVSDTGVGFGPEQQKVIFERFQQADPTITRRFGGTGLGLAICRDLVEAMGGRIDCRSTPGHGAVFWVEVDLEPVAGDAIGKDRPMAGGPSIDGLRVLVVDDNATNRQVAGLILQAAAMRPSYAENGREALAALAREPFDFVLMDMMMPEMDGVEATRRLRAGEAGPAVRDTPLVMLTANTLPEHVAQSLAAGADSHLAKPVTPASLLACITTTLMASSELQAESPIAANG